VREREKEKAIAVRKTLFCKLYMTLLHRTLIALYFPVCSMCGIVAMRLRGTDYLTLGRPAEPIGHLAGGWIGDLGAPTSIRMVPA
jgi:hypothetical protein